MSNTIFDLCIIGTGPAGIVTALEYTKLKPGNTVALIEYGLPETIKNPLDDSIEISDFTNHHPAYECTNKGFGGTGKTWGGRCVMYDDVDFIDRPATNNGCTWDLKLFEEVRQFLPQTAEYFECGEAKFSLNEINKFKDSHITDNFKDGNVTDDVVERWSMPTRFGARFREELTTRPGVMLFEGFEARTFGTPDINGNIISVTIKDWNNGEEKTIKANKFVIAAGTQESTRLLLRNPSVFSRLASIPHALGKYYQSHVSGKIASVLFNGNPKHTEYGFLKDDEGIFLRRRFQFKADFLVKNNLLNTAIWLDNPLYHHPKHKSGPMSFMYMAMITPVLGKKLAPPAIAESITKGEVTDIWGHIWNILKGLPFSLSIPALIFYKRYMRKRKLPGVFLYSPENKYALHFHSEQVPYEKNRMFLANDGEKLIIDYTLTDIDVDSVIELHKELDKQLRDTNSGRLEYWYPQEELHSQIRKTSRDGIHQSGTTRIANTEAEGVVDRNLKVFGTNNLFVCSSSVFPTSGQANPTFFLGVFAVRLAQYLSRN